MKKIFIVLITLAFASCKKEAPVDYAIISGKILNSESKEISLNGSNSNIKEKIKIDENGIFLDTIKVGEDFFSFYDGKNYFEFYLKAGNNLVINFDANDFKNTLKYTGIGSGENNYLVAKEAKINEFKGDRKAFFEQDENVFKAKSNELKSALIKLLATNKEISSDFVEKEKRNINFDYLASLMSFEDSHAYFANIKDFKVSEGFLKDLDNIDFNSEADFNFSSSYRDLLRYHYRDMAQAMEKKDSIEFDLAYLKALGTGTNQAIKNTLLHEEAFFGIKYSKDVDAYFNLFNQYSTDEEKNKEIMEIYNNLKNLGPGKPSPKFVNYENHAGGTTSLDDLLGKYIYIDVWATWCGPCRAEIPYLKEIEKKYHNKNITFLSLSIDSEKDHDKWVQMVKDEKLGGIQLLADNAWESKFVKDYLINGIPHFILLDPQGNIVKYNAPRPSDKKLVELFNELKL